MPLKAAAEKDIAKPVSPSDVAAVGDAWWDIAEKTTGAAKGKLQERAAQHYMNVLPRITGFAKTRIEKRVEALATSAKLGKPKRDAKEVALKPGEPKTSVPLVTPDAHLAVPDAAAEAAAAQAIGNVFKAEYSQTKPTEKRAFALKLLRQGIETADDPVTRYVLFREAADQAVKAGDAETAMKAIAEMAKVYAVDVEALKIEALGKLGNTASTPDAHRSLAESGLLLLDEALAADNYDAAVRIASVAETAARNAKDMPLLVNAQARAKEARELQIQSKTVKLAKDTLATKPDDPDANLIMGRFLCLLRGDWTRGLPLLARGSDEAIKALATTELATPQAAQDVLALSDAWLQYAKKQPVREQLSYTLHAMALGLPHYDKLTGMQKLVAYGTMQKVFDSFERQTLPAGGGEVVQQIATKLASAERQRLGARQMTPLPSGETLNKVIEPNKDPYALNATLTLKVDNTITIQPGVEICGGTIVTQNKVHTFGGTPERPIILRNVTIGGIIWDKIIAKWTIFDNCKFKKMGGVWASSWSVQWEFENCVFYKSNFAGLDETNYGFKMRQSHFYQCSFPEIGRHGDDKDDFDYMKKLHEEWNTIDKCAFVKCSIPPTVLWCATNSNFRSCTFRPGRAFKSAGPATISPYIEDTQGKSPQELMMANPAKKGSLTLVPPPSLYQVLPLLVKPPIPEIQYDREYGKMIFKSQ